MITPIHIRDSASPFLRELADLLERVLARLESMPSGQGFDALPSVVDLVEPFGEFLQVVTSDRDLGSAGAIDHIADVQVADRGRDFVAAISALDRNLEIVGKTHGSTMVARHGGVG